MAAAVVVTPELLEAPADDSMEIDELADSVLDCREDSTLIFGPLPVDDVDEGAEMTAWEGETTAAPALPCGGGGAAAGFCAAPRA